MNREIKFRAWDYFNEVMIYDSDNESDFKFYNGKCIVKYVTEQHTVENGIDIDRPIWNQVDGPVMQYTGLKDKNGKEIYEGDIQDYGHGRVVIVEFKDGCFGLRMPNGDFEKTCIRPDQFKVIGNIHENPELLTNK